MSATPPAGSASLKLARSTRQSDNRKRADRVGDLGLRLICLLAAILAAIVLILIAKEVYEGAHPSISKYGFSFITHQEWAPPLEKFGGKGLLLGTLITSAMAIFIGAPVAISIGIFLALLAPAGVRSVISPLVEMLAAIPSVILGFWGVIIFGPFVAGTIEPFLHKWLGFIPIFGSPQTTGASIFTAGLILTIMVIPIIASVSRDLFMAVPTELQDGAAALGSTRWEVIRGVVLPTTISGMLAATLLGLGRALGEAIAVSQVVGGATESHVSLFKPGGTLASIIALQFPSAISKLHYASLYYCALLLLVIGVAANLLASWIGRRFGAVGGDAMIGRRRTPEEFDPTQPLVATGNLRRRHLTSRFTQGLAIAAAVAAVAVLVIVVIAVVSHGIKAISWDFITKGEPDGIGPNLVGTGIIVGIGTLIAMPIGVLISLFLTEFAGRRSANVVQLLVDVMNGLPSIIIAVFIYILIVEPAEHQSGLAAGIALSIIEVPLIARGTQEVLNLVPGAQREAADALGVARWRSILTIILPAATGGIVTATLLSVARAAGETAPVLLLSSFGSGDHFQFNPLKELPNVPVRIFQLSEEANPEGFTKAWGLSLVLIVIILVLGLGSRALLNRSKRKLTR